MIQTGAPPIRQLTAMMLAGCALLCSGCLTYLGRNHSSLSPRTAAVTNAESTFRSQDAVLPEKQTPDSTVTAGYAGITPSAESAAPRDSSVSNRKTLKARLLAPRFSPPVATTIDSSEASTTAVNPGQSTAIVTSTSGHSVGISAQQPQPERQQPAVRLPQHDLATGGQPGIREEGPWQNLKYHPAGQPTETTRPPGDPTAAVVGDEVRTAATQAAFDTTQAAFDTTQTPLQESAGPETNIEPEPSMLDRLKELYEAPRSSETPSLWRRQFQRLQSPWSVFRDRNERAEPKPAPTEQTVAVPEVTPEELSLPIDSSSDQLGRLIDAVRLELENWPRSPSGVVEDSMNYQRRQQDLRLLHLIANEPGAAISSIDSLSGREQDFWQELMLALAQYRTTDADVDQQQRLTNTVGQLRSAIQHLTPLTALTIRRVEICSRILSYGRVETFPSNDFDPGQPILLYAELENFGAERTQNGSHRTKIDAQLQIYQDGNSEAIETIDLPNITDEATSERRDYFQSFELNLPSHLATGKYQIQLQLRDRVTHKEAKAVVDFQVR